MNILHNYAMTKLDGLEINKRLFVFCLKKNYFYTYHKNILISCSTKSLKRIPKKRTITCTR